jgi:hypothetical protein
MDIVAFFVRQITINAFSATEISMMRLDKERFHAHEFPLA